MRRRASGEREPAAVNAPSARELALAEQLAATGDILRIVSTMGPGSRVEPVLEAIVATAARLCGAEFALAYVRKEDGLYHTVAANRADAELVRYAVEHPLSPGPGSLIGRATLEGGPVHVEDCLADPDYAYPEFQRIGGFRTMLGVPLMRDGLAVGALGLLRSTVSPFSQAQIELVTTFADQAVIAIENVRLFQEVRARTDELGEALRQQTATADVLKVISRSTFNLEAVLDTLVESATRLCDADHSWLFLRDGNFFRWAASFGHGTEVHERIKAYFKPLEVPVDRGSITGRAALEGRLVHVPDVLADPDYTWSEAQHIGGYRAAIGVPLFREGTVIGVIFVAKCLPEPFSANQMELVTTFADQAVIAIENVRLFDEVQARTRELEEALEYQTATGDVLNVISRSPAQIQPVLDTIVETARRLCEAYDAVILLREGDYLSVASHRGPIPVDFAKWPISRGWVTGRAIVDGKPMHVADLEAAAEEFPDGHAMALRQGHRTLLATPLLREDVAIGAIVIRRTEVRPFSEKQIAVLQTFADQAVIAIENARLFEEVQARTAELTEALEQQTATSEVLQVISRSAFDLQTVLDTLVQSAARLGDADIGTITRQRDGSFFREALYGFSDEFSRIRPGDSGSAGERKHLGPSLAGRQDRPDRGCRAGPGLHLGRSETDRPISHPARGPAGAPRQADRRHGARTPRGPALQSEGDRPRHDLRGSGGDRDRERTPFRRSPGTHPRPRGAVAAANRDGGGSEGHQPLDLRAPARARYARRIRQRGCARPTWRPSRARPAPPSTTRRRSATRRS